MKNTYRMIFFHSLFNSTIEINDIACFHNLMNEGEEITYTYDSSHYTFFKKMEKKYLSIIPFPTIWDRQNRFMKVLKRLKIQYL